MEKRNVLIVVGLKAAQDTKDVLARLSAIDGVVSVERADLADDADQEWLFLHFVQVTAAETSAALAHIMADPDVEYAYEKPPASLA